MSKKPDPEDDCPDGPAGHYVTRNECTRMMGDVREGVRVVKRALVGDDLLGGLVRDVGDIKSQVNLLMTDLKDEKELRKTEQAAVKDEKKEKREVSLRWKLAAVAATAALVGVLLDKLL